MSEHEPGWLDGNAIAGLLEDVFGGDMTRVPRGCGSCGTHAPVAAHRVHLGAGAVLRCPACGDVALQVVEAGDRLVVRFSGTWTLVRPGARRRRPTGTSASTPRLRFGR
ncbi:DUF6510 family protein [Baekduia soli]|uniref:DUF6510 family protein n=1 Tax=Baekduia soli TaxID=496014 RepID=UPI001651F87A|nr:DUF6510 family protein [Baekduia soli]